MSHRMFWNTFLHVALISTLLWSCSSGPSREEAKKELDAFLEEFSAATRPGSSIPDYSREYFNGELQKTKDRLAKLRNIPADKLDKEDRIDWKFAQSVLVGKELEQEQMQHWRRNPRVYMNFGQLSMIISRPGKVEDKIRDLDERLSMLPLQLQHAGQQLDIYVPRFQELSVFMAENGLVLFDKELPEFINSAGEEANGLLPKVAEGRAALEAFITFLKEELPRRTAGDFAIGEATYNAVLKHQLLMTYDVNTLWEFGWARFNETVAELEALAATIDPGKTWQQLANEIKSEYPDPYKIIEVTQEWVDKSRDHVLAHELIPIPWPERVKVLPRAEYLRKTSYYGHFSIAKAKDSEGFFTSEMLLNPFEDQWDEKTKQEYLNEHDWGVIIVTAPHETYAGHHVQGLYQLHNPRPLRKNNGISLFSEGWGLYNEQLMKETGFFPNDRIILRQLQLRLWRNARVIYDVGMHTGKMSYEDAINLMTDKVGFLRWASQLEVDAACARPAYFIGYFMGMMEILRMREDYQAWKGEEFTLGDFHEQLLLIGNMPPSLMREALFP